MRRTLTKARRPRARPNTERQKCTREDAIALGGRCGDPQRTCEAIQATLGWRRIHHWRRLMWRSLMLGGLCGLLLASVGLAQPGVVKTRDGQTFEGEIPEHDDQVIVERKGIRTTLTRDEIRSI